MEILAGLGGHKEAKEFVRAGKLKVNELGGVDDNPFQVLCRGADVTNSGANDSVVRLGRGGQELVVREGCAVRGSVRWGTQSRQVHGHDRG